MDSPLAALDAKVAYVEHRRHPPAGYAASMQNLFLAGTGGPGSRESETVERLEGDALLAPLTWVDAPICDQLTAETDAMADPVLRPDDLQAPAGFVLLATPLPFLEAQHTGRRFDGAAAPIRCVAWAIDGERVVVFHYFDVKGVWAAGDHPGPSPAGVPPFLAMCSDSWRFGERREDDTVVSEWETAVRRFLYALWAFERQDILSAETPALPRALSRRAERAGATIPEVDALRVLRLRRVVRPPRADGDPAPGNWTHRWWVRGHWRHLPGERLTFVRAHVKGPDDLPLVPKQSVIVVDR